MKRLLVNLTMAVSLLMAGCVVAWWVRSYIVSDWMLFTHNRFDGTATAWRTTLYMQAARGRLWVAFEHGPNPMPSASSAQTVNSFGHLRESPGKVGRGLPVWDIQPRAHGYLVGGPIVVVVI